MGIETLYVVVLEKAEGYYSAPQKYAQVVDDVSADRWLEGVEQDYRCEEDAVGMDCQVNVELVVRCLQLFVVTVSDSQPKAHS